MTFPTIPTVAAGRVLSTNQKDTSGTRTFPTLSSLTKSSGDLLIAIIVAYQNGGGANANFSAWGASFTELSAGGDKDNGAATMSVGVAYKISNGSETGTFTVTQAATVTGHASMYLLAIPLAELNTQPEAGGHAWGTTSAADPASFNPAGWGTEDTLWISVVGSGETSGTGSWTGTGTTAPTNYSNRDDSNSADNSAIGEVEAAISFRQLNAASEDVGTAGVDTSNARNVGLVIAVRPRLATTVTPGVASLTTATFAPTVTATQNRLVTPGKASLTTATFAPTVTASDHKLVTPSTATLALSTFAPTVATPRLVTPATTALALTTFAPDVTTSTGGGASVTPGTASLSLSTFAPTVAVSDNKLVSPGVASLTLTGFAATVTTSLNVLVTPSPAILSLTTYAPTVTGSGPIGGFGGRLRPLRLPEVDDEAYLPLI